MAKIYKSWYAKVKFEDGEMDEVKVKNIKTVDGAPFKPVSVSDFNSQALYSVKTSKYDKDGKEQRYYAWIGRLAETLEELHSEKRYRWPARWPLSVDDEPANTSQDEANLLGSTLALAQREKSSKKMEKKRKADDDYEQFLTAHVINKPTDETETVRQLREQVKALEAELEAERAKRTDSQSVTMKVDDLRAMFEEVNARKEEEFGRRMKEVAREIFDQNVPKLAESLLRTVGCGRRCDGNGNDDVADTEKRVHLGSGIFIKEAAYNAMRNTEEDRNWAISLLVGVFGEEDAKKLRVYPRKEGLLAFSLTFLTVAKELYRDRLVRMGRYGMDDSELEKAVKKLPSYLADRSLDLNGPRGATSMKKHGRTNGTRQSLKECKESGERNVEGLQLSNAEGTLYPNIEYAVTRSFPQHSENVEDSIWSQIEVCLPARGEVLGEVLGDPITTCRPGVIGYLEPQSTRDRR